MMMNRRFLLLGFLLIFISFGFADSINNYVVPSNVPLNQRVTATGLLNADVNSNVLCSFYLLDAETNFLITRATSQYTDSTGRFAMPRYIVTEPDFQRGRKFTLKTTCGNAEIDANFFVEQKQEVLPFVYPQGLVNDLRYWAEPSNSGLVVFLIIFIVIVASIILYIKKGLGY